MFKVPELLTEYQTNNSRTFAFLRAEREKPLMRWWLKVCIPPEAIGAVLLWLGVFSASRAKGDTVIGAAFLAGALVLIFGGLIGACTVGICWKLTAIGYPKFLARRAHAKLRATSPVYDRAETLERAIARYRYLARRYEDLTNLRARGLSAVDDATFARYEQLLERTGEKLVELFAKMETIITVTARQREDDAKGSTPRADLTLLLDDLDAGHDLAALPAVVEHSADALEHEDTLRGIMAELDAAHLEGGR